MDVMTNSISNVGSASAQLKSAGDAADRARRRGDRQEARAGVAADRDHTADRERGAAARGRPLGVAAPLVRRVHRVPHASRGLPEPVPRGTRHHASQRTDTAQHRSVAFLGTGLSFSHTSLPGSASAQWV